MRIKQETNMPEPITPEVMEAAASAHLMIDRAAGAMVPHMDMPESIYHLGFAAGADWMLQQLKPLVTGS